VVWCAHHGTCRLHIWHDVKVTLRRPLVSLASLLVLGCSPDTVSVDDGTTSTESSSGDGDGDGDGDLTTDASTTDPETETETETETGDPGPYCGDGVLDPGEECDDSNNVDGDGCSPECDSDCGIDYWVDISLQQGWFNVQAMEARPGGRLLIAGDIIEDGVPGVLRVTSMLDDAIEGAMESAPLGPPGTQDLPQTHQVIALAVVPNDDLVVLGTSTEVMVVDEPPVVTYWLARFAGVDLVEQWRTDIPVLDDEERPLDVAVLANGDAILTMTTRVADNDTDIGFERRSGTDGSVMWTSSHTGEFNGGYSFDTAALVAVGEGDRVWAAGIVRVDWQTWETTVFELDPADGMVLWSDVPLPDPGNVHEQRVNDLSAGPDGMVAVGINVFGPASPYHFGGAYLYEENALAWSLVPDDLPWEDGIPYVNPRISIDADGEALVAGTYTHDFEISTASRTWVVGVKPDGVQLCAARVGQGADAAIVPRSGFFDGGRGALNLDTYGPGGMGPMSDGDWIAGIRGW
jgi:cysteine-rich repeat protein